ncbi:hypothetical protein ACEWY4_001198 [Coilia grayii]|uniref:Gypsy retrotransposon integrase-like protein 1 n=1 Tax=Coilia grayii TaxID=363190 RepID=A0ABD1KYW3_9TELE
MSSVSNWCCPCPAHAVKLDSPCSEGGTMGSSAKTLCDDDLESIYVNSCALLPADTTVVYLNSQRLEGSSDLFYTPVMVGGLVSLKGMLDSGSMSCTLSEEGEMRLKASGVLPCPQPVPSNIVLIGCGGLSTHPKCIYELEIEVSGSKFLVPTFVISGQRDEFIIGTNVLKPLLNKMKSEKKYWDAVTSTSSSPECEKVLELLTCVSRWAGQESVGPIGTVRLRRAITLQPKQEYLVWGKLPSHVPVSQGSTVIVEPTTARSAPKNILVGRVITPMWGDHWIPMRVLNPTEYPVRLRRNTKLADVSPCMAVEDLPLTQGLACNSTVPPHMTPPAQLLSPKQSLDACGLVDVDIDACEVSDECKSRLAELLSRYRDVFSKDKLDCGEAREFVHRIHLTDDRPFRLPYRRIPPAHYHKLREVLSEMEEKGIIRKSISEYASPLVMVWKRNGDLRICTDFRWLNAKTVKDAHPLPHQSDCLAALGGNALFSTMDLTSGFYNIPLHESDKHFTAFTTPLGLYEYNRLPQGLCNSPASFMRMMLSIFGDLNFSTLLCYLDDLLVFAPSESEALCRLEVVFTRLRVHNLKLSQKKCHFLRKSVKFLGHVVNVAGVSVDQEKVNVISSFTAQDLMMEDGCTPSQKRVRSFLGMVMYYQHFIPGCSSIAKPLFALTAGQKRRGRRDRKLQRPGTYRELTPGDWTPGCVEAFEDLKRALMSSVVLAHPDFNKPFVLCTDASLDGLGAVLSQVPEGEDTARPIAFASKSLSRSQANYPAHRLEFLALKWAVCDKFSHWLKGHSFTVWTDNNPLTYILTKPKLDACEQRWVSKLAPYTFDIKHVPGTKNVVADALSREPFVKPVSHRLLSEPYMDLLQQASAVDNSGVQDMFRLTCNVQTTTGSSLSTVQPLSMSGDDVSAALDTQDVWEIGAQQRAASLGDHLTSLGNCGQDILHTWSKDDLRARQLQDDVISRVIFYVDRKLRPSRRERVQENLLALKMLREWQRFQLRDGILYRVSKDPLSNTKRFQYVVPNSLKADALAGVHDLAGHQGQPRTLSLARQRFFWYDMEKDVRHHVRTCMRCVLSKTPEPAARAPLQSIKTTAPLELVCIDFWSAEDKNNKSVDVLVVTDHFTKLAHAFPCQDQTAKKVAKKLWDNFFCVYGFPTRLHSDQGASFESELIAELMELAGVQKSHTSPYHPMGNGGTERFNRTLGNMLRSLPPQSKLKWPQLIQTMTFVYNCTVHETTGFAPFYLMFGRVPRLPVDLMFRSVSCDDRIADYDSYVKSLASDLKSAMQAAQKNSRFEQRHQAEQYNKRVKGLALSVGDRVLIANKGCRGKRKLADKWEPEVCTVVAAKPSLHIYKVKDSDGNQRVLHRNLLLSVNFLPLCVDAGEAAGCMSSSVSLSEAHLSDLSSEHALPTVISALPHQDDSVADRTSSWVAEQSAVQDDLDEYEAAGPGSPVLDGSPDASASGVAGPGDVAKHVTPPTPPEPPCNTNIPSDGHLPPLPLSRFGRVIKPVCRLIESMTQLQTVLGGDEALGRVIHV